MHRTNRRPKAVRLIGIDIDGTLVDSLGRVPEANRRAVSEAVAAGIHVALATGRSFPFARPVADGLPESVTLIVSNGAVERGMDGATLARRLLNRQVARDVLDATLPYRGHAALIFDRDEDRQFLFESMDWEHPGRKEYWSRNQSRIAQAVPLENALTEDPIQVMFNGAVEAIRVIAGALGERKDGFAVALTEYVGRDFSLLDVTAPNATKRHALAWRAEQLGLTAEEVMAVGDNFNDLGMLEFAGVPVVMGNAVDALKRPGWEVTGHHDECGLADAIRRFALGRR